MGEVFTNFFDSGSLIDIVSCVFTVLALVFTLYFWLLDHLSEEESEFIKEKHKYLKQFRKVLGELRHTKKGGEEAPEEGAASAKELLSAVKDITRELEIMLNYRFWGRSRRREDYEKINEFYQDSRFLLSTLERYLEGEDEEEGPGLLSIRALAESDLREMRGEYCDGLVFIINFVENWS